MLKRFAAILSSLITPKVKEEESLQDMYERGLPRGMREVMERQTYKFDVAHALLMERFKIPASRAKSYTKVLAFLHKLLSEEESTKMREIMRRPDGRRQAFNLMVEMRDITPFMLNTQFPLGEKRNQFERWLDGKLKQLP